MLQWKMAQIGQMDYVICTAVTAWSDPEASLLLERVNEYQPEVGPMKKFKNKKAMWEKISGDILAELGSLKTAAQCENRYKTVRKRKSWVDSTSSAEKTPTNPTLMQSKESAPKRKRSEDEVPSTENDGQPAALDNTADADSIITRELINEHLEDEVDVRRGVGQVSFNLTCDEDDADGKHQDGRKRFRQTLASVLLQIHREKEEAKERRHQEKMELLKLLFQ